MKLFFFISLFCSYLQAASVSWTMVNVNAGVLQGDSHVLEMPDGKVFLIDACDNDEALLHFLRRKQIKTIDSVLISHAHRDHYSGLLPLLRAGIRVKEVRFTFPHKKTCDAEIPWGCNWEEVQNLRKELVKLKVPLRDYRAGEKLYQKDNIELKVLVAYDGIDTPVGSTDVNDTSAVLKLTNGQIRALFTGDLNRKLGGWLAEHSKDLEAEILKVPHHGAEAIAPLAFFDKVNAKTFLIPTTAQLWNDARTLIVRNYLKTKPGNMTFVSGLSGEVQVLINEHSYTLEPERHKALYVSKLYLK